MNRRVGDGEWSESETQVIGTRIGIMAGMVALAVVWTFIGLALLFSVHGSPAMLSLDATLGGPARTEKILIVLFLGGGLIGLSLLCGFLQPATDTPWRSGFVWCPFTWLGLLDLKNPHLVLTVTLIGVAWLACGLGMKLKALREERQQHGGQISSEGAPSAPPNELSP